MAVITEIKIMIIFKHNQIRQNLLKLFLFISLLIKKWKQSTLKANLQLIFLLLQA